MHPKEPAGEQTHSCGRSSTVFGVPMRTPPFPAVVRPRLLPLVVTARRLLLGRTAALPENLRRRFGRGHLLGDQRKPEFAGLACQALH
jgi:hypothetical protein